MTDNEKMTKILGELILINDVNCLKTIQQTAKSRKDSLLEATTLLWKVTDKVQLLPEHQGRRPYGAVGTIKKINKIRMKIDFGESRLWNVPKTMLMKA